MGKCGGRELNYVSDVDVIYVVEPVEAPSGSDPVERRRPWPPGRGWPPAWRGPARRSPRRAPCGRSTPPCARRARAARWSAPCAATSPTTSGGRRPGSSRRCSRPARWPATWSSASSTWTRSVRWSGGPPSGSTSSRTCRRCADGSSSTCRPGTPTASSSSGRAGCATSSSASSCCSSCTAGPTPGCAPATPWLALEALSTFGYVGRDDAAELDRAYRMLRTLEHRIQLYRLRRTHVVPGRPGRPAPDRPLVRLPPRPRRRAGGPVAPARAARSAGCTRSSSTVRCWPRPPG